MKKKNQKRKKLVKKTKRNTSRCALYREADSNTNCHGC